MSARLTYRNHREKLQFLQDDLAYRQAKNPDGDYAAVIEKIELMQAQAEGLKTAADDERAALAAFDPTPKARKLDKAKAMARAEAYAKHLAAKGLQEKARIISSQIEATKFL